MGIERSLRPVAAVSGVGAAGRGRPFGVEELAGGGGRGGGTLLRGTRPLAFLQASRGLYLSGKEPRSARMLSQRDPR